MRPRAIRLCRRWRTPGWYARDLILLFIVSQLQAFLKDISNLGTKQFMLYIVGKISSSCETCPGLTLGSLLNSWKNVCMMPLIYNCSSIYIRSYNKNRAASTKPEDSTYRVIASYPIGYAQPYRVTPIRLLVFVFCSAATGPTRREPIKYLSRTWTNSNMA